MVGGNDVGRDPPARDSCKTYPGHTRNCHGKLHTIVPGSSLHRSSLLILCAKLSDWWEGPYTGTVIKEAIPNARNGSGSTPRGVWIAYTRTWYGREPRSGRDRSQGPRTTCMSLRPRRFSEPKAENSPQAGGFFLPHALVGALEGY